MNTKWIHVEQHNHLEFKDVLEDQMLLRQQYEEHNYFR
jgi:hypothetical protein